MDDLFHVIVNNIQENQVVYSFLPVDQLTLLCLKVNKHTFTFSLSYLPHKVKNIA